MAKLTDITEIVLQEISHDYKEWEMSKDKRPFFVCGKNLYNKFKEESKIIDNNIFFNSYQIDIIKREDLFPYVTHPAGMPELSIVEGIILTKDRVYIVESS